jgi:xylan 1,4-beta-xylosidase
MNRRDFVQYTAAGAASFLLPGKLFAAQPALPQSIVVSPDWKASLRPIRHSWKGLGNVDQMRWIMRRDMQEQLALCQKEIGLRHVRAVGIFDDDMWVYDRDPANFLNREIRNVKRTNWRVPFYIYDSLLERGLSPVVTTCFTPEGMKSGDKTTFDTKVHITPPRDWKEWKGFVTSFVKGLIDRYGLTLVQNWYFEVWNEPNLSGFWTGGKDGYLQMYQVVHEAVKNVNASLKVGGPSTAHAVWIEDLLSFGKKNTCMPDYIIGHIYNNDSAAGNPLSPFEGPQGDKENKSPNFVAGTVRGVRKLLDEASYTGEFHMNEWGLSWHPFAPVRETANEAAFIIKTMNEVSQLADYFAYWCLSDIYNQIGYGREAFHGNYGMLSLDGLRKPSYHAHQLLCLLGDEKYPVSGTDLSDQCNAFVTRNSKGIQAIIYAFDISYQATDAPGKCKITFTLPEKVDLNSLTLYKIDSHYNNIINQWKEMGSPAYLDKQELDRLRSINHLTPCEGKVKTGRSAANYTALFEVETPGVVMLTADYTM